MTEFVVVIPSRYESTRLPGKPLRDIYGKPMIQHVVERGSESGAREVIVATDDDRIAEVVEGFGGSVCMTGTHHQSGTERIAEVADLCDWSDDTIVVNLQGDEPAMPPQLIDLAAGLLADGGADIATLASPVQSAEDFENPNVVKVVRDYSGHALYFSRAAIPFPRDESTAIEAALQHHGIYAYRCRALRAFVEAEASPLERTEQLEQLRALSMGMTIAVGIPDIRPGTGVDTEADLAEAEKALKAMQ
ncbi:MAG: 3-deoxy-manno-octulosonate cytidylyltransferase [Woeseiaceae bacterium]|nr:3-deoxy-manno-octulosonate cytidylyltransferase [Woeseiaceae bacterium]